MQYCHFLQTPHTSAQNAQLPTHSSTFLSLNASTQCRDNITELSNKLRMLNCGRMKFDVQI
jgi:hypothetical protein